MHHSRRNGFKHLRPGHWVRVAEFFTDHDGRPHAPGPLWRFEGHDFLPYEDGLTLRFLTERGADLAIRLQWRPEAEAAVIDNLGRILPPCPAPSRATLTLLAAVDAGGFTTFDRVARGRVAWRSVRSVSVGWGEGLLDAHQIMAIRSSRWRRAWMIETDPLWPRFIEMAEANLPGALPRAEWEAQSHRRPAGEVTIWRAGFLRRLLP